MGEREPGSPLQLQAPFCFESRLATSNRMVLSCQETRSSQPPLPASADGKCLSCGESGNSVRTPRPAAVQASSEGLEESSWEAPAGEPRGGGICPREQRVSLRETVSPVCGTLVSLIVQPNSVPCSACRFPLSSPHLWHRRLNPGAMQVNKHSLQSPHQSPSPTPPQTQLKKEEMIMRTWGTQASNSTFFYQTSSQPTMLVLPSHQKHLVSCLRFRTCFLKMVKDRHCLPLLDAQRP